MSRLSLAHWQALLGFLLVAALFTASIGGVTAGEGQPQAIAPTPTAKTRKSTKTPSATKTRKAKKTRTATPTDALTETPAPSETLDVTPTATETPTAAGTRALPAPKQTRKAKKTQQARKTRRAEKSPTPTPTLTRAPKAKPNSKVKVEMRAAQGGILRAQAGWLTVTVPPGALPMDARLTYKPLRKDKHKPANNRVVINRFALNAYSLQESTHEITTFNDDLTIAIEYEPAWLGSWNEEHLQIVYWDEELQTWEPLQTFVDTENHIVRAETDHFTDYGLANAPDVQNYLPGVEGFQTDLFSGAAGYSFPIHVPPGQGGLTPRLNLSYSSTGIDGFNSDMTASYVGVGWSLDTSYVARDTQNTADETDDTFSLVLNGAGYDLVKDGNNGWRTSKEQFWKITRTSNGSWKVRTNDGTLYTFGETAQGRGIESRRDISTTWYFTSTFQYWLEAVQDTHNNKIVYEYNHDTYMCNGNTLDRAVYPDRILYNSDGANGWRSRIKFQYTTRSDYHVYYSANSCGPVPYNKNKLDRIEIRTNTTGTAMPLVRTYLFEYDYSLFPGVYNDYHNQGGGSWGKLALKKITVKASDDTSTLPSYTFQYKTGRLNLAYNGIGGSVDFDYEKVTAGPAADKYDQDYTQWTCGGTSCALPEYAFWTRVGGAGYIFDVRKDGFNSWSLAYQLPPSGTPYLKWKLSPFNPGGWYTITDTFSAQVNGIQVQLRLYNAADNSETNLTNWTSIPANTVTHVTQTFNVPYGAKNPEIRLYATHASAPQMLYTRRTLLQPLSTHNRIKTKKVDDGLGNVMPYSYQYEGIATNDAVNSQAAQKPKPRHPMYSQFRGHRLVTVLDPLGNKTLNQFAQDDIYAGKAQIITQTNSANAVFGVTRSTFGVTNYFSNTTTGERVDFVKLNHTIVETWDGSGSYVGKRTGYSYDSYGNISETREFSTTSTANLYRKTVREFFANTNKNITNKVARVRVFDNADNLLSETQNVYDTNSSWNAAPGAKGELKQVLVFKDGSSSFTSAQYGYDAFGNVTSVTDANGNTTITEYDPQYNVFATQVTPPFVNADLSATTGYNVLFGLPTSTTDANGAVTTTEYDVFGRRWKIWAPGESQAAGQAPTAEYAYCLPPACAKPRVHVKVRKDLGGAAPAAYQEAWYFYRCNSLSRGFATNFQNS